jgi:NitT/TauT family transport system permease protein
MPLFESLLRRLVPPVVVGIGLLALWIGLKSGLGLHDFILPSPIQVLKALSAEAGPLFSATLVTSTGALIGFSAALLLGFGMALLLASCPSLRAGLYPYVLLLQLSPLLATAAIVVIFLDVGLKSVATIAFLIGFFPVLASTLQGLRSVPQGEQDLFRLYGASFLQQLFLLRVPTSLPYFFTGAKIAATLAVIGAVTGEIFAGSSSRAAGLGFLIITYKAELRIDALYAATFICCLLGFLFVGLVLLCRHALLHHWHESARTGFED